MKDFEIGFLLVLKLLSLDSLIKHDQSEVTDVFRIRHDFKNRKRIRLCSQNRVAQDGSNLHKLIYLDTNEGYATGDVHVASRRPMRMPVTSTQISQAHLSCHSKFRRTVKNV